MAKTYLLDEKINFMLNVDRKLKLMIISFKKYIINI